jgi:hypothetical protein
MNKRLLISLLILLSVSFAFADEKDSLSSAELGAQLSRLQNTLRTNEKGAETWWITWTALYTAATVGQGAVAVASNDLSTRQDMVLGAGTTLLGVASQLLTPVSTKFHYLSSDSIAKLSVADKQHLLTQGEAVLKKQSDIALAGKSWQTHALFGVGNLASGLITWIGFKRPFSEGVFNFALNMVITETQIWTQPIRAKKAYQQYLQSNQRGFEPSRSITPEWYGQVSPASCSFGLRF